MSKSSKIFLVVFSLLLIAGILPLTSFGRKMIIHTSVGYESIKFTESIKWKLIEEIKWNPLTSKLHSPNKQLTVTDMEAAQQYLNEKKLTATISDKIPTIEIGIYDNRSIVLEGSSCWGGDYCPNNEITWIAFYKEPIPESECGSSVSGDPIITVAWGPTYHGCSPVH